MQVGRDTAQLSLAEWMNAATVLQWYLLLEASKVNRRLLYSTELYGRQDILRDQSSSSPDTASLFEIPYWMSVRNELRDNEIKFVVRDQNSDHKFSNPDINTIEP